MNTPPAATGGERGSAIVVVLALLLLIMAFLAGNDVTLRSLQREAQLIDQRQLRKYESTTARSAQDSRATPREAADDGTPKTRTPPSDAPAPEPK